MKLMLKFIGDTVDVPNLWIARDGRAYYRPAPKKGGKSSATSPKVELPTSSPETQALLCSYLDERPLTSANIDQARKLVSFMAGRLPFGFWESVDKPDIPDFGPRLMIYFDPSQLWFAILRMTAMPHLMNQPDAEWEEYMEASRLQLATLTSPQIEAILQVGQFTDEIEEIAARHEAKNRGPASHGDGPPDGDDSGPR